MKGEVDEIARKVSRSHLDATACLPDRRDKAEWSRSIAPRPSTAKQMGAEILPREDAGAGYDIAPDGRARLFASCAAKYLALMAREVALIAAARSVDSISTSTFRASSPSDNV